MGPQLLYQMTFLDNHDAQSVTSPTVKDQLCFGLKECFDQIQPVAHSGCFSVLPKQKTTGAGG